MKRSWAVAILGLACGSACAPAGTRVVSQPEAALLPCSAPPPRGKPRVYAGLESGLPTTAGALRLVDYTFDDRLASPGPRVMTWGDANRLLTVERDRAIVWDVTTGAAVASLPLPKGIVGVERVAAKSDLTRAAALVRVEHLDGGTDELLSIDFTSSEASLFGSRSGQGLPFAFSDDGESLTVGAELWDTDDWTLRDGPPEPFAEFGKQEAHPRREAAPVGARPGTLTLSLMPVSGPRLWQRLLAFGPRKLEFLEATLDVTSTGDAASFRPVPGRVSITAFDGAPEVRFDVPDPDALLIVSPSGRWVGTLAAEFTLRSATSADPLFRLEGTAWANRGLISDDGKVLVLGYTSVERQIAVEESARARAAAPAIAQEPEQRLEAWDLVSGRLLYRSKGRIDKGSRLSADGRYLWAPASNDVVDLRSGALRSFDRPLRIVSSTGIGVLRDEWGGTTLVDLATGRAVLAPERRAKVLAASNDGRHFATLSPDWSLQLETPDACTRIEGPPPAGQPATPSLVFTGDSSTLVVGSYGYPGHSVAWDTRTARPVPPAQDHAHASTALGQFYVANLEEAVTATAASPDHTFTVSATLRGDLTITRANGAAVSGQAYFAPRHDHVIRAWFPEAHRLAVQTARGGVFEFQIGT